MDSSVASLQSTSSDAPRRSVFRFFDLPSELRIRIYQYVLFIDYGDGTIDLDYYNNRRVAPRLTCFLACRQMHNEAYPIFYGSPQQPFRLFPTGGNVYKTKKPLLERIGPTYRGAINTLELRVGPGWNKVPKCWHTGPSLGLADCISLRNLKVFVQIDPTDKTWQGYHGEGNDENTYKTLCVNWLQDILEQAPSVMKIELDAYEGVELNSPLVHALASIASSADKKLVWGPTITKKRQKELAIRRYLSPCAMDEVEEMMTAMVIRDVLS